MNKGQMYRGRCVDQSDNRDPEYGKWSYGAGFRYDSVNNKWFMNDTDTRREVEVVGETIGEITNIEFMCGYLGCRGDVFYVAKSDDFFKRGKYEIKNRFGRAFACNEYNLTDFCLGKEVPTKRYQILGNVWDHPELRNEVRERTDIILTAEQIEAVREFLIKFGRPVSIYIDNARPYRDLAEFFGYSSNIIKEQS